MLSDDILRQKVKELKLFQNVPYKEIAELLDIKTNSLYNWLKCQYSFSETRKKQLEDIINIIKE